MRKSGISPLLTQYDVALQFSTLHAASPAVTAAAAQFSTCQLLNPVGSGVIIKVLDILVRCGTVHDVFLAFHAGPRATAYTNILGLSNGGGAGAGQLFTDSLIATSTPSARFATGTALATIFPGRTPIILLPGMGVEVENPTAAEILTVTYIWGEF